ncbi:MAG: M48 family metalloprotease [Proteobacteria bacterium]|nr:M48 family metalloprotease [Pseudomonadota bacterium]
MFLFLLSLFLSAGLVAYGAGYPAPEDPNYGKTLSRKSNALALAAVASLPLWVVAYDLLHGVFMVLSGADWVFYGFEALDSLNLFYLGIAVGVLTLFYVGMRYNLRVREALHEEATKKGGRQLKTGDALYDMVRLLTEVEGISPPEVYVYPMDVPNIMVTVQGWQSTPIILIDQTLTETMTRQELAAVLLHELGHVKNRDISRAVLFHVLGGIATAATLIFALINTPVTSGWAPLMLSFILTWGAARMAIFLLSTASSRRNEFHADYFSARRMDPQLLVAGLFIVEEAQRAYYRKLGHDPDMPVQGWVKYLASHPPSTARYDAMRRLRAVYHKK